LPRCTEPGDKETIYENLDKFLDNTAYQSGYWYPLEILTEDIPVIAYDIQEHFEEQTGFLEAVMRECGIETVTRVEYEVGPEGVIQGQNIFELLSEQDEYEVSDFRFWRPRRRESYYTFPKRAETYYFDHSKSWLVYVSHAGTIAFAGAGLAAAARRIIPAQYMLRGWG